MKHLFYIYCLSIFGFITYMTPQKTLEKSISDGKEVYQDFCTQCHLEMEKEYRELFLLWQSQIISKTISKPVYVESNMVQRGKITVNGIEYDGIMSMQGLDDEEVADVMNYILNSWGNKAKAQISITQVTEVQKK